MASHSRVDQKGLVTLPYLVRKFLGVAGGGRVEFRIDREAGVVTLIGAQAGLSADDGDFTDLARENAARRLTAARGLAALRGGIAGPDTDP